MLQGPVLLMLLATAIVALILLIARWKLHAFLTLLLVAFGLGLASGMAPVKVLETVITGFGNSAKAIGIVILFGTIIGTMLDKSGAALTMADYVLKKVGPRHPALAMNIIGWIVSIPVFCDSGFVILSSLNKTLARRSNLPMATMAVALATGLSATHVLVPPTPGPIAAAANMQADLGMVILMGLAVSIPVALAGLAWGLVVGRFIDSSIDSSDDGAPAGDWLNLETATLPDVKRSFAPIVAPIALIGLRSVVNIPAILGAVGGKTGFIAQCFNFIGDPVVALLVGLVLCVRLVPALTSDIKTGWVGQGISEAGSIIMITAAGGSLGAVIADTSIGATLGETLGRQNLGIFLPFVLAAALKTAQGSSTVALITGSTILYPLLGTIGLASPMGTVIATLALGSGSLVVSHSNDSYFWVVSQFSGLDVHATYKTQTMATLCMGAVGILCVWGLSRIML